MLEDIKGPYREGSGVAFERKNAAATTERSQAIMIAERFLDAMDPDSSECILARQFLRALERLKEYNLSHDAG